MSAHLDNFYSIYCNKFCSFLVITFVNVDQSFLDFIEPSHIFYTRKKKISQHSTTKKCPKRYTVVPDIQAISWPFFFFFVLRYKDKFNIRLDFRSPPLDDTIKHHNVRPLSIHIVILVVEGKHQMVAQCNGPNRWTIHEVQLCFALTFSVFAGNVQSKCSKYAFTH